MLYRHLWLLLPALLLPTLLLWALPLDATAQQTRPGTVTIVGTVTDAETDEPLENVNVFIAGSQLGTATDASGRYRLERVPLGAQRLFVSRVGYNAQARNLNLREAGIELLNFELQEATVELDETIVTAERDEEWLQRLERFKRLFIGETPNAEQTELLNPEVLDFSQSLTNFRAFADEPLELENQALGYRLTYFLEEFEATSRRTRWDGEPLFEAMDGTPEDEARWRENRREAFLGSFHHLMLALISGRVEGQQFRLFLRPSAQPAAMGDNPFGPAPQMSGQRYPIEDITEIMEPAEAAEEWTLDFRGVVEIAYMGAEESEAYYEWIRQYSNDRRIRTGSRFQTSQIWLERGPATIDYKGDIVDPYGVTRSGYFAYKRIADQLPKEYRPN